jgi:hypothetical protein
MLIKFVILSTLGLACLALDAPKSQAKISLVQALERLDKVKQSILQDRVNLRGYKSKMSSERYAVLKLRLDRREAKHKELEASYREQLSQLNQERKIRASAGAEFYLQQSRFYEPMLTSDIDLILD